MGVVIEICYEAQDHRFRCGNCDSLNIEQEPEKHDYAVKCPDCGYRNELPTVTLCDCGGVNQSAPPLRMAWERSREAVIRWLRRF
jgi:DNA-directed RNA polymerase subunit RPC12/RpoP